MLALRKLLSVTTQFVNYFFTLFPEPFYPQTKKFQFQINIMGSIQKFLEIDSKSPPAGLTDDQIIADLQCFRPVTSERNVWAFWDRGIAKCPTWSQRNVISWVRRLDPSWTVRVLDLVDNSPAHVLKYIHRSFLPEALLRKRMTGSHKGQHSSDLVRVPLVYVYGGVWMDIGFKLFKSLDSLLWNALEDPTTPYEVAIFNLAGPGITLVFNGLFAARKGSHCMRYWHTIFQEVWKNAVISQGLHQHPLLRHLPEFQLVSAGQSPSYALFGDYIAQALCLERLRHLTDPQTGWDGPHFFANHVLVFDCIPEIFLAEELTGWNGRRQFELLSCPYGNDAARENPRYEDAEAFLNTILDRCVFWKFSHGLPIPGRQYLAAIWDQPENCDADRMPGTFAARLLWASEHLEQTRELVPIKIPLFTKAIFVGGILEVAQPPTTGS